MAAELPRPGVEVIQVFQSTSPTVVTPTLSPCVVGVCRQVVDVTSSAGLNSEALLNLPACFIAKVAGGSPAKYTGLDGHDFTINLTTIAGINIVFSDPAVAGLTPTDIVTQVNTQLAAAGVTDAIAEVVGTDSWRLRTLGRGDFESIVIAAGDTEVLTAFGLWAGQEFTGVSSYTQSQVVVPSTSYPDPRSNLSSLTIEPAETHVYLSLGSGSSLRTLYTDRSFLRKTLTDESVIALDDGNGDGVTPYVKISSTGTPADLTAVGTVAEITAHYAPDLGNLINKTLILSDGRHPVTITFPGVLASVTAVVNAINAAFDPLDGIVAAEATGKVKLTANTKRETGTDDAKGADSMIRIIGGSAVSPTNYLDSGATPYLVIGTTYGSPMPAAAGDLLYVDGSYLGKITQVAPGGQKNVVKIDKQILVTTTGTTYYIEAMNCVWEEVTRPKPDLYVDAAGNAYIKHDILRDAYGAPVAASAVVTAPSTYRLILAKALIYLGYQAIRKDVTVLADKPGLLKFDNTVDLAALLAPVTTANPLALAFYFALLNAPGATVLGLGVDEVSADSPYGTVEAFTRAAEYLETAEVYAIAPMTHDVSVFQVMKTHVDTMSASSNKGERVVLINGSRPTTKNHTLVASGLEGSSGIATNTFETGLATLSQLLLAQGIDPSITIPVSDGVFLDVASDSKAYSIQSISGGAISIRVAFSGSENADAFYTTDNLPDDLLNEPFAIRIRGAALVRIDGSPDKDGMAETMAATAEGYLDHRVWSVVPDKAKATLGGLEQEVEGFYLCAAIAGMIGQQPPQQSFTNFPMTGFTGVVGANDYFSERQLNLIAGGGNYIIVQDAEGAPLTSRMALTTDLTSIETRTDSVTKVVDFTAKFMRKGLKNYIGRFNITQGFLDSLGGVIQGLLAVLVDSGVLIGANLNNILQDTSAPDTVLIDVTLDVPFPCNYIRLTLTI